MEINRKIRKIEHFRMWKATELRTFLLYSGPICLKHVLKPHIYDHFMLLSCAIRILCDSSTCIQYNTLAHEMLRKFVLLFGDIYGSCYISYNVHNLVYLSDDVKQYGHLDNFSTFKFESYMFQLKRMIKKGNQQLQQVVNRTLEKQLSNLKIQKDVIYPELRGNKSNNYCEIRFKTFSIKKTTSKISGL